MRAPLIALLVAASTAIVTPALLAAPAYASSRDAAPAALPDGPGSATTPGPDTVTAGTPPTFPAVTPTNSGWSSTTTPWPGTTTAGWPGTTPAPGTTTSAWPGTAPWPGTTPSGWPGGTPAPGTSPSPAVAGSPGSGATSWSPMSAASALAAAGASGNSVGSLNSVPSGTNGGLSTQDQSFIATAVAGTQFEIMAGQVAQQRAGDQRIRAFAAEAVTDHGAALAQLNELTQTLGVGAPAQPAVSRLTPERQSILAMWGDLSGAGFDCSYASTEYLDHEVLVAAFQDEVHHGDDPRVHLFAVTQLPALESHLNLAGANLDGLSCGAAPAGTATPMPFIAP